MRPQVLARLRDSFRLLRRHPFVMMGVGAALVLSLGAVCCGLGLLAAPWFACELMALQLGALLGRRVPRRASWVGAGLLQGVAVVVLSAAAWLAMTWLGGERSVQGPPPGFGAGDDLLVLLLAVGGLAVAVVYLCPFVYAPLILLDRGGSLGGALLDSSRLVGTSGLGGHAWFCFCSHVLQLLPVMVTAAVTMAVGDRETIPYAVASAVPLLAVSVPLGQGMLAAAYAERRDEVPRGRTLSGPGSPPVALAAAIALVGGMPPLAMLFVGAALVTRPASPAPGRAPASGEQVASAHLDGERQRHTLRLPGTSLRVRASRTGISVEAGDGGGAGRVPFPSSEPMEHVSVVRVRDAYAIEMRSAAGRWAIWVDRTGVRLDDDLSARLRDHLPAPGLLVVALAMLAAAVTVVRTLRPLAELRRQGALPPGLRPDVGSFQRRRYTTVRAAWLRVLLLLPLSTAAVVFGLLAL